jgi:hypothetical protein
MNFYALVMVIAIAVCSGTGSVRATAVRPARSALGFNEWDAMGGLFNETLLMQYAAGMKAQLHPFGYEYCVIDGGWHGNYEGGADEYGRMLFDPLKYPAAAQSPKGMGVYADRLHSMGLKFGLWTCRGVPVQIAQNRSLRVKGTQFAVGDIVDRNGAHCPWNSHWLAVNASHPAAQAYYDSIVELFADWNLDFIKWDCMDSTESRPEMLMASSAIERSDRPIRLSLSLGPLQSMDMGRWIENSTVASSFRVTTDFWGGWGASLSGADIIAKYAELGMIGKNNSFPDLDMMPFGRIKVSKYPPRGHEWTDGSVSLMMTLYVLTRGPLMFGGELPITDNFTLGFMTNRLAYDIHANSTGCREVQHDSTKRVWTAALRNQRVVGVLNANHTHALNTTLQAALLGGRQWRSVQITDVWGRSTSTVTLNEQEGLPVHVPKAGGILLVLTGVE